MAVLWLPGDNNAIQLKRKRIQAPHSLSHQCPYSPISPFSALSLHPFAPQPYVPSLFYPSFPVTLSPIVPQSLWPSVLLSLSIRSLCPYGHLSCSLRSSLSPSASFCPRPFPHSFLNQLCSLVPLFLMPFVPQFLSFSPFFPFSLHPFLPSSFTPSLIPSVPLSLSPLAPHALCFLVPCP